MRQTAVTRRNFLKRPLPVATNAIYPPGATSDSLRNCTGCGECVAACPNRIISLRAGVPSIDFGIGECTFCGQCAERCPENVFPADTDHAFQHRIEIGSDCLALNYVDCQACRDVCYPAAIRFTPRMGGPFIPTLSIEACTGCGACISVCPTRSLTVAEPVLDVIDG